MSNVRMTCEACVEIGRQCPACRKRYLSEWEDANRSRRSAQKRANYEKHRKTRVVPPRKPKPSPWKHGDELVRVATKGWGCLGG